MMISFADLVQHGSSNLWLFIPTALLLGALHGLEAGHSRTMMAAFIIAVWSTVGQAVLLGLRAALSHTAIVWGVAPRALAARVSLDHGALCIGRADDRHRRRHGLFQLERPRPHWRDLMRSQCGELCGCGGRTRWCQGHRRTREEVRRRRNPPRGDARCVAGDLPRRLAKLGGRAAEEAAR